MSKRYLAVISLLCILVGCFFLFFDKPTNKELYNKYYSKLERCDSFNDLSSNDELIIFLEDEYINNQYHYVITFTSSATLNNFKAMVVDNNTASEEYYPSFGIIDNKNTNLVSHDELEEGETRGVNLVVSSREKIETFRIYVSYNNYEYFYLMNAEE